MARASFIALISLGIVTGVVFAAFPWLDLQVASFFLDLAARPGARHFDHLIALLRKIGPWIIAVTIAPAVITLVIKAVRPRSPTPLSFRAALFLVLSLVLGPGLLVNAVLKETWSRPRPSMVTEFGGTLRFMPWWDPRGGCTTNCSFASGETSAAVWTTAPAMLVPPPWRYLAFTAAGLYSLLFAFIRMLAGGHFLSDVIFAAVFTGLTIWTVHGLLFRWRTARFIIPTAAADEPPPPT